MAHCISSLPFSLSFAPARSVKCTTIKRNISRQRILTFGPSLVCGVGAVLNFAAISAAYHVYIGVAAFYRRGCISFCKVHDHFTLAFVAHSSPPVPSTVISAISVCSCLPFPSYFARSRFPLPEIICREFLRLDDGTTYRKRCGFDGVCAGARARPQFSKRPNARSVESAPRDTILMCTKIILHVHPTEVSR